MTKTLPNRPPLEPGQYHDSMAGWDARSPDGLWWVHGGWVITKDDDDVAVDVHFRSLTIEAWDPDELQLAVTSSVLRSLPLGRWLASARAESVDTYRLMMERWPDGSPERERLHRSAEQMAKERKPGRRGYPDSHWAEIAERYLELDRRGTRAVSTELAAQLGVPVQTAKDWVSQARKRGYLTPAQPGRSGGAPGPELIAFLERGETDHGQR